MSEDRISQLEERIVELEDEVRRLMTSSAQPARDLSVRTLRAEMVEIVESDGTLRLSLHNKDQMRGPDSRKGGKSAGILFFDEKGHENGGLTVADTVSLMFDQEDSDQVVGVVNAGEAIRGLYVWESAGWDNITDAEDQRIKFGVQVRDLTHIVDNYDGQVWIRKLQCQRDSVFFERLRYAYAVADDKPYDEDPLNWIRTLFDINIGNVWQTSTFSCSALVGFVYTALQVLHRDTPWALVWPKDLSQKSNRQFKYINDNGTLGRQQRIK